MGSGSLGAMQEETGRTVWIGWGAAVATFAAGLIVGVGQDLGGGLYVAYFGFFAGLVLAGRGHFHKLFKQSITTSSVTVERESWTAWIWAVIYVATLSALANVAHHRFLPPPGIMAPVVEASYDLDMMGLPLKVPPFSAAPIIRVRDGRKVELMNFYNSDGKVYLWPTKETLFPPAGVGIVRFSNHGNASVFNMAYSFNIRIGAEKGPGGVTTAAVKLPIFDLPANGLPREFPIVDETGLGGIVDLTNQALAEVQGSTGRQKITLSIRVITFFDKIPMLPFSTHKWDGDKILDPDMRPVKQITKRTSQ
jgi:hypothetical protein